MQVWARIDALGMKLMLTWSAHPMPSAPPATPPMRHAGRLIEEIAIVAVDLFVAPEPADAPSGPRTRASGPPGGFSRYRRSRYKAIEIGRSTLSLTQVPRRPPVAPRPGTPRYYFSSSTASVPLPFTIFVGAIPHKTDVIHDKAATLIGNKIGPSSRNRNRRYARIARVLCRSTLRVTPAWPHRCRPTSTLMLSFC